MNHTLKLDFEKKLYTLNKLPERAKIVLNLTSEGLRYPPEVRVEHKTYSTKCGRYFGPKEFDRVGWGGVREGLGQKVKNVKLVFAKKSLHISFLVQTAVYTERYNTCSTRFVTLPIWVLSSHLNENIP